MNCERTECFYCAKGKCVSLTALKVDACEHFLHKELSRARPLPKPRALAAIRARLERHGPAIAPQRAA